MQKVRFDPKIAEYISSGDVGALRSIFGASPEKIRWTTPFAGGSWLHYAAGHDHVSVLELLVELGLDVNQPSAGEDARSPICDAADAGKAANAQYLLDAGSAMDTSASVRNPLFAAIVGRAPAVVRLMLERGIDATARYNSDTMIDMDALAFAVWRSEDEIARIIASHLARGEGAIIGRLLQEARDVVARNAPLKTVRIVPAAEDLEGD